MTSVIIPAHNEAAVITALLDRLLGRAEPGEFEVLVICNGCSDDTAEVAAAHPYSVRVIEISQPSKALALVAGDEAATGFPRLYVDADVELDTASARALVDALRADGVHAVAPERDVQLPGSARLVRSYYRIWRELPVVQRGLFGRGVLGVDEQGYRRIADRPPQMGDDLYLHSQFGGDERAIVAGAVSVVYGPKTLADLMRRRVRAARGNAELSRDTAGQTDSSSASRKDLVRLARRPQLWPSLAAFATITVVARNRAHCLDKRAAPMDWLRDESSRSGR